VPSGHQGRLEDYHLTRDHVPPDGIFCEPKPTNLITVPCCHRHNGKHSGAALEITRNEGGAKILEQKVFGSTFKKRRQPKFVAQVVGSMRNGMVMTADGPKPVTIFSTPGKELLDCAADITRGLLTNFYPEFNYHRHHFTVLDIHSATLAKGDSERQLKVIRELATKTPEDHRGNFNEFRFWRHIEPNRRYGAWLIVFYEALAFSVIHTPIPLGKVLGRE
jgi:hypothetical protein